ncbi:hypothetical protein BD408DRAFT_445624 [Parasitella parasitica]|nr:hypothetical protein BD408DRAFT_445624 [Parasitella parasitica]
MAHELTQYEEVSLDKCQTIFIIPNVWCDDEQYKDLLCLLFSEAGLVAPGDHKNRLICMPFLDCYVNFLRNTTNTKYRRDFKRERKYLLYSLTPNNETGGTILNLTCFQMQNAKELSAVSSKLATGELLLTPTVLQAERIDLPDFKDMIQQVIAGKPHDYIAATGIKEYDIGTTRDHISSYKGKISEAVHHVYDIIAHKARELFGTCDKEIISLLSEEIISQLPAIYQHIWKNKRGSLALTDVAIFLTEKPCLKDLNLNNIIAEICGIPQIELLLTDICNLVLEMFHKFNPVKDAPDGIHEVILYDGANALQKEGNQTFYKQLIRDFLVNAGVVEAQNDFHYHVLGGRDISIGAMRKPFTMIEIVNSFQAPLILDNDVLGKSNNSLQIQNPNNDLLPPNSFYIHVHVAAGSIHYVLNKVIETSAVNGASKKSTFTVKTRTISLDNIADSACDHLLNHMQALASNDDEYYSVLFQKCGRHQFEDGLTKVRYDHFFHSLAQLVKTLMSNRNTASEPDTAIFQTIPINSNCGCTIQLSHQMILEIGLKPAITNFATMVASSLVDNDLFGRFHITSLIITGICETNDSLYQHYCNKLTREKVYTFLRKYQKGLNLFFGSAELKKVCLLTGNWEMDIKQVLKSGKYDQISSTTYIIKFIMYNELRQIYEYNGHSCQKPYQQITEKSDVVAYFVLLSRGEILDQDGMYKTFITRNGPINKIKIYTLDSSPDEQDYHNETKSYYHHRVASISPLFENHEFPLTIRIIPDSNNATIKFEFSSIEFSSGRDRYERNYEQSYKGTFKINERLTLQNQHTT